MSATMKLWSSHIDPDAPAAVLADRSISYGLLRHAAATVAATLRAAEDGAVVLACERLDRFVIGLLGTWQANRTIELPASLQPEELERLRLDPQVAAVLRDEDIANPLTLGGKAAGNGDPPGLEAERIIVCLHTSGSTGKPTRIAKTARQLLGEATVLTELLGIGRGDRILATVPLHHIYGLLFGVLVPLAGGAAMVAERALHAESVGAAVRAHAATVLVTTPAHLRFLVKLQADIGPSLTTIVSSGAPLPAGLAAQVAQRWGIAVTEVFGSTETGGIATRKVPTDAQDDPPWQPLPGVRVEVDKEQRLWLASPFLADEGAVVTADRARLVPGGFVHMGRADDIVKVAGRRASVAELQRSIEAIPGVMEAAVWSDTDDQARGTRLCAVVAGEGVDADTVRRNLARRFDPAVIPRPIRIVDALPRSTGGKPTRALLQAVLRDDASSRTQIWLGPLETAGEHAHRGVRIPQRCELFEGHFPGGPVLPGVAELTEIVLPTVTDAWPDLGAPRRISRLKFRRPIGPGDTLTVELKRPDQGQRVSFTLRRPDTVCATGTLWFAEEHGR